MNWKSLSNMMEELVTQLASELGKVISNDIFDDGKLNVALQHKNIDILKEVEGTKSPTSGLSLAHSINQVLYTRNINIVPPFAFKRNLVLYSVTNSKELATMNRKCGVCGSSRTLSNVICEPVPLKKAIKFL